MNNTFFRSGNDVDKDNYKIVFLLLLFLLFRIFYIGIYPFINGEGNLYLVFKPVIFYIIYYLILMLFNKKNDSYYIVSSLIISFIVPINISLYVFIIGSIIGVFIDYISKNRINNVTITLLLITIYLSINNNYIIDIYSGIFIYIYILLLFISLIYLNMNKLIKTRLFLISLINIILITIINNNFIFDIVIFCLLFIVSDNRYSPITKYGQLLGGIIFCIFIYIFKYIFELEYFLYLSIFSYELLSIAIDYFSVKLCDNKVISFLFSFHKN